MTVTPLHALSSTIPIGAELERLTYIGEASGKACRSSILYFIPLEHDASIYDAKRAALRDASKRHQRQAIALIDVSIDVESVSYVVYERVCTWVRGKALGPRSSDQPTGTVQPPRSAEKPLGPRSSDQPTGTVQPLRSAEKPTAPEVSGYARKTLQAETSEILASKQFSVLHCLELDGVTGGVSVTIRVSKRGTPQSFAFAQTLAPTTKVCIRDVLARVAYPEARQDYEIAHAFGEPQS